MGKEAVQTALFSLLIFTVGFLGINAAAYSDIFKASLLEWKGETVESPLVAQHVESESVDQKVLAVERTVLAQKKQIPELNLAVTPPDNRLIIPKIERNIPIMEADPVDLLGADWKSVEQTFQKELKEGVIHYPGTADPGTVGNVFITGHSSYYPWDDGRYKTIFARLNELTVGDDIVVYYDQKKYRYVVREKKEVKNNDVSVLEGDGQRKLLTLMTCSPVGTNFRRLVVTAELVE